MGNRDKVERLIRILRGEEPDFEILIIDRTSDPVMLYNNLELTDGKEITKDEADKLTSKNKSV